MCDHRLYLGFLCLGEQSHCSRLVHVSVCLSVGMTTSRASSADASNSSMGKCDSVTTVTALFLKLSCNSMTGHLVLSVHVHCTSTVVATDIELLELCSVQPQ